MPLALKVLGSFLYCRSKAEWESELEKLKVLPNKEIQDVLRKSYDGLDDNEKYIFLDIACFYKGQDKDYVKKNTGKQWFLSRNWNKHTYRKISHDHFR